ncbi:hypothetical protein M0804_011815 [Polistes exclamans]|nr:hypothetical protein M0804_011815 [Polistes exclamans]
MKRRIRPCTPIPLSLRLQRNEENGKGGVREWATCPCPPGPRERAEWGIIAGGLMRRHNCTIIDYRFIRRPGPAMELGPPTCYENPER